MNFLSHYLLDAAWISDEALLGTVLVDICRLRGQGFRLKAWPAEKSSSNTLGQVLQGILRHYEVDAWWHNSHIFTTLTKLVKDSIAAPSLHPLPRDYFFAHICAEMLLDRVLMQDAPTAITTYYVHLHAALDRVPLADVLTLSGDLSWLDKVDRQMGNFMSRRFLEDYVRDEYFLSTVFGLYRHVTGAELPQVVVRQFEAKLPNLEASFRAATRQAGLLTA